MADKEAFKFPDEIEDKKEATNNEAQSEDTKIDFDIEGDVDVEVKDDTPEQDRGYVEASNVEEVTEEELESYGDKVRRRIKEISHLRHDERRAKEAALREREELERVAKTLMAENSRLKKYVSTGEEVYAGTLKSAAEAELQIAKKKYKDAHEAFDADALVEAQSELLAAQLKLEKANNFKPTPLQESDPVVESQQNVQATPKPDEKTLRWQAKNQWFGPDDEMTAIALVRHKQLVNSGVDPRSDEYYEQIDAHMRRRFPDFFDQRETRDDKESVVKKPATVVAPATRSTGAKKIILTKSQVNIAKRLNVPLELYAKKLAAQEAQNG
jgi:hypothetical protein